MIHIDLTSHASDGRAITDDYLKQCWDAQSNRYVTVGYDHSFGPSGARRKLTDFLFSIQKGYCCYCMRKMDLEKRERITLEHIIPKSISSSKDMEPYFKMGHPNMTATLLRTTTEFNNAEIQTPIPPYPHDVAYDNISLSCDGSFRPDVRNGACCNNKRGDQTVNPVYLYLDIEKTINFLPNGYIYPDKTSPFFEDTVNLIIKTDLNCSQLKEIRRIWYALRNYSIDDITAIPSTQKKAVLLNALMNSHLDSEDSSAVLTMADKYGRDIYWDTLMSYLWFHKYYKEKSEKH